MGQYWKPVNLTKREYIEPHRLGSGMKLWEQLAAHPGTAGALVILCAAMPESRGGGDLDVQDNWHGPERTFPAHNTSPGPMPEAYPIIARRTIGRWAGDRIALIGDYAENDDLPGNDPPAPKVYDMCSEHNADCAPGCEHFTDVTDDVCAVIEHELGGKFTNERGWREFVTTKASP